MQNTQLEDYKILAIEIIKSLRGEQSQNQINKKLGFDYNQMSKWERGQQNVSWDQMRRLIDISRKNLRDVLQKSFGFYEGSDWPSLFQFLCGLRNNDKVSVSLGISMRKISDWRNGRMNPTFAEVLLTFDRLTVNLPVFLKTLAPETTQSLLKPRYEKLLSEGKLIAQHPEIGWVICCLELAEYQDGDCNAVAFISQRTNLGEKKVRNYLAKLYNFGLIRLEKGRYVLNDLESSPNTGVLTTDERIRMKIYFAEKAIDAMRLTQGPRDSYGRTFNHIFFNASNDAYAQIKELSQMFYEQVRHILTNDDRPKQHLGFLNVHLCNDGFLNQGQTPLANVPHDQS